MTADELRALLAYDPLTGKLYWRVRPLDYFTSEREAAIKYDSMASVFYGEFANLNSQQGNW